MSAIEKAIRIALCAHMYQKDKAGAPYILHPLRVMFAMENDAERIAAVLHDVVEDSAVTIEDLKSEGISEEVCFAVAAVTKQKGELYNDYLKRVKDNPIALKIKLADLKDNMDLGRIAHPTEKDLKRIKKYKKALTYLLTEEGGPDLKETFFDSEGVPFVEVNDASSSKVFRLDGNKRVRIEDPRIAAEIVLTSMVVSRERAMELASERGDD